MKPRTILRQLLVVFLTMTLVMACNGDPNEFLGMPLTQSTPVPTITPIPIEDTVVPEPEQVTTQESTPDVVVNTILLWLPPFMDPASGSEAGVILQAQLDAFVEQTPNVEVVVRIKAETGPASLLESLTAVSAVAPLDLPSLVVLDRNSLESAAKKGLILPIGDYSTVINEVDWFQYARSLSIIGDSSYGLPLIGNALVMVVRETPASEDSEEAVRTPTPAAETVQQIAYWQGDPDAALLLNYYLSLSGPLVDEENQVILDREVLTEIFTTLQTQKNEGLFYTPETAPTSNADVWNLFLNEEIDIVIVPSRFPLAGLPENCRIVPLTSFSDYDHTLAKGWIVALADPLPERRELAVTLAQSLTEVTFMGAWSEALGYLPVRATAFDAWQAVNQTQRLSSISISAEIYPSQEITRLVAPALQAGLNALWNENLTPEEAAQVALDNLIVED